MSLFQFVLALLVLAVVTFGPALVLSERRVVRARPAADTEAALEGRRVAAEMADFNGLREQHADNAHFLAQSRRLADNAVETTKMDRQQWERRAAGPELERAYDDRGRQ
jgi:hypothetical protein